MWMAPPAARCPILLLTLGIAFFMPAVVACTVVADKPQQDPADKSKTLDTHSAAQGFKPNEYVDGIWDSRVLPYFRSKCVPIGEVLALWAKDQQAAGKAFGYREKGDGSPWNFLATGAGTIVHVDTASAASTVAVDLNPPDGKVDLVIQIGPVIKDTGIRDSLAFISFTQFTNQLEFAELSNAFNKKVKATVLSNLNRERLVGRHVAFRGVFTQPAGSAQVRLTPVELEVK